MSNFSLVIKKTYEFEGDTISVEFKPLTKDQMISISPYMPEVDGKDKKGKPTLKKQSMEEMMKVSEMTTKLLKDNLVSFEGLVNDGGDPISIDDVFEFNYFSKLLNAICSDFMGGGSVDEKN